MAQTWQVLSGLGPLQTALLTFLLGLLFGSFGYATYLRLSAGVSLTSPRSKCPHCAHVLGARDLVPLLSFVFLGGRCRRCQVRIPFTYPLAELGMAAGAGIGGYAFGWSGGAAFISLGLGTAAAAGLWRRRRTVLRGSPGYAMLETLVALSLITFLAAPVLNVLVHSRVAIDLTQQRTVMIGLVRERLSELEGNARLNGAIPGQPQSKNVGTYKVDNTAATPLTDAAGTPWESNIHQVTVTVSCPTCRDRFDRPLQPISMMTYLWTK